MESSAINSHVNGFIINPASAASACDEFSRWPEKESAILRTFGLF